jgi:hypothetical protein
MKSDWTSLDWEKNKEDLEALEESDRTLREGYKPDPNAKKLAEQDMPFSKLQIASVSALVNGEEVSSLKRIGYLLPSQVDTFTF